MAFFMPCLKKSRLDLTGLTSGPLPAGLPRRACLRLGAAALCAAAWPAPVWPQGEAQEQQAPPEPPAPPAPAAAAAGLTELRTQLEPDGELLLTAHVRFVLADTLEQVLLKGVPLHFMAEAIVSRHRWYWRDRQVVRQAHYWRLAYQPLLRYWRVWQSDQPLAPENGPVAASVPSSIYDSLQEALTSMQSMQNWRIVNVSDLQKERRHTLGFRFTLQERGLPRPLQADERIEVQRAIELT